MLNMAKIERLCLQATVALPLFAILVCLAVQSGLMAMPMRELALLCMGVTAAWCIFIPRLASFTHVALFGFGVFWSALVFGIDRHGLTGFAPLLQIGPHAVLFGLAIGLTREETTRNAA